MKLLTNLSATVSDGDYREPRGAVTTLHVEPVPGVHLKAMLGAAGLLFIRGEQRLALPLPEILKLIAQQHPELLAVSGQPSPAKPTPIQQEVKRLLATATESNPPAAT